MKKLLLLITLVVGVAAFALPGQAATLNLETIFSDKPSPTGISPWLYAETDDSSGLFLTLTASLKHADEKVGLWYFNLDPSFDSSFLEFAVDSSSSGAPAATTFVINKGNNSLKADGDGYYDIEFDFSTSTGATFDNSDWIKFSVTTTSTTDSLTADSFNFFSVPSGGEGTYLTAAHIQTIGGDEDVSTWIGAVPIPASVLLLGSGLIGVAGFKRKIAK